jgi:hypothetical protein
MYESKSLSRSSFDTSVFPPLPLPRPPLPPLPPLAPLPAPRLPEAAAETVAALPPLPLVVATGCLPADLNPPRCKLVEVRRPPPGVRTMDAPRPPLAPPRVDLGRLVGWRPVREAITAANLLLAPAVCLAWTLAWYVWGLGLICENLSLKDPPPCALTTTLRPLARALEDMGT